MASCSWCQLVEKTWVGKKEEAAVSSQAEENKALVLRFFEARVKTDLDALEKMLAPDFVSLTKVLPGQPPDREGYKWSVAEFSAAFSDVRFNIEEQIAKGDKVVTSYTVHATHDRKELLGVAPTGREMASMAIYIHRVSGGKITEEWSLGTVGLKLMEQRRERIEQELLMARSIQQASLPKEVPQLEGWQITPYYQPGR
jgi:predicted ester cyclase